MMKLFDFHTHAFVDSIAERAVGKLAETSGIIPYTNGTISGLKNAMLKNEISCCMILPVATKASQQMTINEWAASVMKDGIYCCGSVFPDAEDVFDEISRIKKLGLFGVKLHPEYQGFFPDDEKMFPIYKKIAEEGLFVVFHGGYDPLSPDFIRGTPERFAKVAQKIPELTFVVAHLGGMNLWDDVEKYIAGKYRNIYIDVSVIAGHIDESQLLRIIRTHGADKVLFGSDCPWDNPINEINMINRLPLRDKEKELIFHENAERLLGLL